MLLIEELNRCGVTVFFLNGGSSRNAEDELLVQVQGVIAEYERAKILERSRRGKIHKAQSAIVNVLSAAPYGYQYVRKSDSEPARYQVVLHQAKVVRQVFRWFVEEQVSIRGIATRLTAQKVPTRTGKERWATTAVWGILKNPAYAGRAAFGKTERVPRHTFLRPSRGRSNVPRHEKSSSRPTPPSQWVSIAVPALVSEQVFEAAQEQLARNRRLAARNSRGQRYLLQGLVVCARCGYAFLGRTVEPSRNRNRRRLPYYYCRGSVARWFGGTAVCHNPWVRVEQLDGYVWESVCAVLQQPDRVVEEWTRRGAEDGAVAEARQHRDEAQRMLSTQQNALRRLQDAYEVGALTVDELAERTERVRARIQSAQQELTAAQVNLAHTAEIKALAGKLSTFAEQVRLGLDKLDWQKRQQLIRTLVSKVEIDEDGATIVYRIPAPRMPGEPIPTDDAGGDRTGRSQLRSGRENPSVNQEVLAGRRHQGG